MSNQAKQWCYMIVTPNMDTEGFSRTNTSKKPVRTSLLLHLAPTRAHDTYYRSDSDGLSNSATVIQMFRAATTRTIQASGSIIHCITVASFEFSLSVEVNHSGRWGTELKKQVFTDRRFKPVGTYVKGMLQSTRNY